MQACILHSVSLSLSQPPLPLISRTPRTSPRSPGMDEHLHLETCNIHRLKPHLSKICNGITGPPFLQVLSCYSFPKSRNRGPALYSHYKGRPPCQVPTTPENGTTVFITIPCGTQHAYLRAETDPMPCLPAAYRLEAVQRETGDLQPLLHGAKQLQMWSISPNH